MDFRTCPACQASVLEDDVDDCPFCGASMTGKPSARPAAAAPAQKKEAAAPAEPKAAPKSKPAAASKRAASAPSEPAFDEGDPFEVDTRAMVKASPVSRKPAKGRMMRVVCPMCETPGFISPRQAGQEVKCVNPKCLVPVFTAPEPKAAPEPDPEPSRGLTGTVFTIAALVLIAAVGAGLYFVFLGGEESGNSGIESPDVVDSPVTTPGDGDDSQPEEGEKPPPPPPPVDLEVVKKTSLTEIVKAAQQRDRNRSKPYGRRLAAESFVDVGDLQKADVQLNDMRNVPGYVPFYEIEPLVMIAIARYQNGNLEGARAAIDDALSKADLPQVGRTPLDAAGVLAAALYFLGRTDDAVQLASTPAADVQEPRARLSTLWRGAIDAETYSIEHDVSTPALTNMPRPQWVTVTRTLLAWDKPDLALQWVRAAPDRATLENCAAVWAAAEHARNPAATSESIGALAGELEASGQARLWAAVAYSHIRQGDDSGAAEYLQRAVAALQAAPSPSDPMPTPSMKDISEGEDKPRLGLPDPMPLIATSYAALDVAEVQVAMGDAEAGWSSVEQALHCLRATAPSPEATEALVEECQRSRQAVESRLASQLGVDQSRLFLAFNRYRKQCGRLHELALERMEREVRLIKRAIDLSFVQPVWEEILAKQQATDLEQAEPWFATTVPAMVLAYARFREQSDLVAAIAEGLAGANPPADPVDEVKLQLPVAVEENDFSQARSVLQKYQQRTSGDRSEAHLLVLAAVSRLISQDDYKSAIALALAAPDPLAQEDALWWIAASSVRDGRHSLLWREYEKWNLPATSRAALYRGLIAGLDHAPQPAEPSETDEPAAEVSVTD
ncbi:MAG: hypothetical protein DWQ45_08340 [Planctomycetota bacterium]|nr:MAG: hypothetical protein DWQ41_08290 [Planctomycetota bacterium]REK36627.1 MAG: hypothetical protein DWQ45_08340 [Planctomycetota bacterium]